MRYKTGVYHLHLFDKHGVKLETLNRPNFMDAQQEGEHRRRHPPVASFAITRVLHNSIDTAYPWDAGEVNEQFRDELLVETFGSLSPGGTE